MCYNVYDSQDCSVESYEELEDAVRLVSASLTQEEKRGRLVDAENNGRWAVYDGLLVKVVWIESDDGLPISFNRQVVSDVDESAAACK